MTATARSVVGRAGGRGGAVAWTAGAATLALVPLPLVKRDGEQRADIAGPLDLLGLDCLPDSPGRNAELGGSLFHEHVISLHRPEGTEFSGAIIDYSAGQFHLVPCTIIQSHGEFREQMVAGKRRDPVTEETTWRGYGAPPHVRAYVFARDGHACRYCGASGDGVVLEADHVIPTRLRGPNVCRNLVAACRPCNRSKGSHTVDCWRARYACWRLPPYFPCVIDDPRTRSRERIRSAS